MNFAGSSPHTQVVEKALALELSARYRFKASFQSATRREFKEFMLLSQKCYESAATLYSQVSMEALAKKSHARSRFAEFWRSDDFVSRKGIIRDCIAKSSEALRALKAAGRTTDAAETCVDLLGFFRESLNFSSDWKELNQQFQEAATLGRVLVDQIGLIKDDNVSLSGLATLVWLFSLEAQVLFEPKEFKTFEEEVRRIVDLMVQISKRQETTLGKCLVEEAKGNLAFDFQGDYANAKSLYETAAELALKTGDSLARGRILWLLAQVSYWLATSKEDAESKLSCLRQGLESAQLSIRAFSPSRSTSDLAAAYASCAECNIELANQVETVAQGKDSRLRNAVEVAGEGIAYETGTWGWSQAAHSQSKARYYLSKIVSQDEKKRLLAEAMPVREATVRASDALFPHFWNRAVMRNYSALLKADLSVIELDLNAKTRLLHDAARDMEACLDIGKPWATSPGTIRRLAQYSEWFGIILAQLFEVTRDQSSANQAIGVFEASIDYLKECGFHGGIGPIRWRIARIYDSLGDLESASNAFKMAAEDYSSGAQRIPGSASAFDELSRYMKAWQYVESARWNHDSGDYSKSAIDYATAVERLQSTKTWQFLSGPFSAQSFLERGEALSYEEKIEAAIEAFKSAENGFTEARNTLQNTQPVSFENVEARDLGDWLNTLEGRDDFCHFRILLEEARLSSRSGDRAASARKFRMASDGFRGLTPKAVTPSNSVELETLALFCEGWGKMEEAESISSAKIYSEATEIFSRIAKLPSRRQYRLLGLANSSICRALEVGTIFSQYHDTDSYAQVKRSLQAAADYYHDAGSLNAEQGTRATQRLFDALVFISQAESRKDPTKKAQLYGLAETHLEQAARFYDEAGFVRKKEDVLRRLEKTREQRQLLSTALQSMSQIPGLAGSTPLPVTLPRAKPSGLDRFDEAFVVGELSLSHDQIFPGSVLTAELDVANVGKAPATLLKIQNMVPEGFTYVTEKNLYPFDAGHVNLTGKRLDHLQTLNIKLVLMSGETGQFEFHPRIFFADDKGSYKSAEFPVRSLKVLGIESEAEGARLQIGISTAQISLPADLQFETERARLVFNCLVKEFLGDYIAKRFIMDAAGWRTFMEVAKKVKVPKSSFYGVGGRIGPVLAELEHRGLVETRVYSEQRGRGGEVRRLRVAYDNLIVRELLREATVKRKSNY